MAVSFLRSLLKIVLSSTIIQNARVAPFSPGIQLRSPSSPVIGEDALLMDPSASDLSLDDKVPAATKSGGSKVRRHLKLILGIAAIVVVGTVGITLLGIFAKRAVYTTVDLGYAQYRGVLQRDAGVKNWLGMRYAASPVGELRFAAPQNPITMDGIQDATKHGKACLSVNDRPPVDKTTSEDCLFLDVFAPSQATAESMLPVFFFIQGGGFAGNANANYDAQGLIAAADFEIVVVTSNYRVGPYGFLSGTEVESPNNGLKDQRKALDWVRQHISKFGGNPNHVVLGGVSAGAASITVHMSAYGGKDEGLFHAAALESPSFATMLRNNDTQYLYNALVNSTSCVSASDTLSCLRSLSTDDLQRANRAYPYPGAAGSPVFSWNPVIDGDLIQDYTYGAFSEGKFVKIPTIVGDDTNGGTVFAPRNISTLERSNTFLMNTFPYLNASHLEKLNQLYPNNPNATFPNTGSYWRRTANVYGEIRYMCPNLFLASALNTYGNNTATKSWNYRYNVQDPEQVSRGLGVPHTAELAAIWGPGNVGDDPVPASYKLGKQNAAIVPMMQEYWTSFIRSLDPNRHRKEEAPEWKFWTPELIIGTGKVSAPKGEKARLLLDTPVKETTMEVVDVGLWERCEYLWSIGLDLRQ